jgi:hypothetical protein
MFHLLSRRDPLEGNVFDRSLQSETPGHSLFEEVGEVGVETKGM